MNDFTNDQVRAADKHLVTVAIDRGTITGILALDEEGVSTYLNVISEYQPGTYDEFSDDNPVGREAGLGTPLGDVVGFTDHGDRSDALLRINQTRAALEQARQAALNYEKDLQRLYAEVTNLAAQEG